MNLIPVDQISEVLMKLTPAERQELCDQVGLPYQTCQKVALGLRASPRANTYFKLVEMMEILFERSK